MMKQLTFIIAIVFTSTIANAQLNNLSNTELFESIRFNNVSLGTIMETKGDLAIMRVYFGNSIQEVSNNTGLYIGKELYNNNIVLSFEDESDTGNNYSLTSINVRNSSMSVQVKGVSIKIGDHKRKLKNFLFNADNSSYNFTDRDTGSVGLSFRIDNSGNVSAIEFISF